MFITVYQNHHHHHQHHHRCHHCHHCNHYHHHNHHLHCQHCHHCHRHRQPNLGLWCNVRQRLWCLGGDQRLDCWGSSLSSLGPSAGGPRWVVIIIICIFISVYSLIKWCSCHLTQSHQWRSPSCPLKVLQASELMLIFIVRHRCWWLRRQW